MSSLLKTKYRPTAEQALSYAEHCGYHSAEKAYDELIYVYQDKGLVWEGDHFEPALAGAEDYLGIKDR